MLRDNMLARLLCSIHFSIADYQQSNEEGRKISNWNIMFCYVTNMARTVDWIQVP